MRRKKTEERKLKDELWELCKQLTRKKYGLVCYTCGAKTLVPHTGHFIPSSVGGAGLRYDLRNLRPQCYVCNIHKSGNWPAYFKRMVEELGNGAVEHLMADRMKFTKADKHFYSKKILEYQKLLKK